MLGLVNYSSSESEPDDSDTYDMKEVGNADEVDNISDNKVPLPKPENISKLFGDKRKQSQAHDNPSSHGGRIRSFAHEDGNWATLVYAQFDPNRDFLHLQQQLFQCLRPLEFKPVDDYHVSFSRTVTIRHHWIHDITQMLMTEFARMEDCGSEIDGIAILSNDENTRTFLALTVTADDNQFEQYARTVDVCFEQYKLQKYYQPPSFHISIGWCLGDVKEEVTEKMRHKMTTLLEQAQVENSDLQYFYINKISMKTGNKEFTFPLNTAVHRGVTT